MCGVAGLVSLNGDQNIRQTITKMVSAISHRGPDGEGIFCHENVALGQIGRAHVRTPVTA